jgi:serine/threonine protein kinase
MIDNELSIVKLKLSHKNIIQYFDHEIKDNFIYIVMEYCD